MIFCRHRICRTKLKKPVSNKREAFCSRGCHTSFYLKRCLVCEGPLQRRNKTSEGLPKIAVPQRLAGPSRLRPLIPSTAVSLASKTLILLGRNGHPNPIEHGIR